MLSARAELGEPLLAEMTAEAYAKQVGAALRTAHGASLRDPSQQAVVQRILADADQVISGSELDQAEKQTFWKLVLREFHNGVLMLKADNSALHQLMRQIEEAIAQRQAS